MSNSSLLTKEDKDLLHSLRSRRASHRRQSVEQNHAFVRLGMRISDAIAAIVGSWPFIILQSLVLIAWLSFNALAAERAWDPYPFILLNLVLSFQAAYTAPMIMMSQNRQSDIDRQRAEVDYHINVKAELEIELLHQKIDLLREQEILALSKAVNQLVSKLNA
jgi:uncharacterized membrane protein